MKRWLIAAVLIAFPSTAVAELVLEVRNRVTDLAGNDITSIEVGQQFKLQTIATDIRNPPPDNPTHQGVFSANAIISFDAALSSLDPDQVVDFGSFFNFIQTAQLEPGLIQGFAASASFRGPGNSPQFVFSVTLTAESPGLQVFTPEMSTDPDWAMAVYTGDIPLSAESIEFVGTSLQIVPEPSAVMLFVVAIAGLVTFRSRWRR
jgi:hypothetical protein